MTDLEKNIHDTVIHLKEGKTILYPTDTIWGIGCDATDSKAIQNVFRIKKRPDVKSVLLLASSLNMVSNYVLTLPADAYKLITSSDRPLTIIYQGARNLPSELIGEDGSIGIRVTKDPFCSEVITQLGVPLVSTSANISGTSFPGSFTEIDPQLIQKIDYVVQWRQQESSLNIPSKIIKFDATGKLNIIRE